MRATVSDSVNSPTSPTAQNWVAPAVPAHPGRNEDGVPHDLPGALGLGRTDVLGGQRRHRGQHGGRHQEQDPMIFSTMPTAAASFRPRRLANTVMARKDT